MKDLYPTNEKVAISFLRSIADLNVPIATALPADDTTWPNGFIQITATGGTPSVDLQQYQPVLTFDVWYAGQSEKPQWGKANDITEQIRHALQDGNATFYGQTLDMGPNVKDARVLSAWLVMEPRRLEGNAKGYARFTFDVQINWTDVN